MKRIQLVVVAVVAAALLAGATGLRRVPDGQEALRVARDGTLSATPSGWTFVGPGTTLIRYPVGEHSFRAPEQGAATVLFEGGDSLRVAFEFALSIPAGASVALYRGFSQNFVPALERAVVAAAEMEAAGRTSTAGPEAFRTAVAVRVARELSSFGISIRSATLLQWGDHEFTAPSATSGAPRRLIIVGVDGGDWINLKPLMDAGRLPNFARLVRDGATGPLRSEEPMLSPLLWTTMATGRLPEQHGVLNFTVADPKTGARVPISRHYRRVDAFWNMLGDAGRSVSIVGWLATDPAETINGVMVTDKFGYLAFAPQDTSRAGAGSVSPASRAKELSALVVHTEDVGEKDIARFVHVPASEHRGDFDPEDPVNNLMHLYASTRTFEAIALRLLEHDRPDVFAVYFEWVDAVSHLFMLHAPPRMPDVPADEYGWYKDAVEQAYVLQDEILGDIMSKMDDRTVLMVVSDHGFKSGDARLHNRPEIWAGNAAKWHRLDGIVAFYGAGVKRGLAVEGASIIDVAPTILALMGLPRAQDMPGKAIRSAFTDDVVASFSVKSVPTLDRKRADADSATAGGATEETMKKLEALGYLTPDNADAHNNLGQRYQQQGQYQKAIEAYGRAIALRPNFHAAYNNLAVCYGKLGRYADAEKALQKCIALKPDDFYAMNNLAVMMIQTGRVDEGAAFAERAVKTEPGYANGHVTLGSAYATKRRYDDAEREFREALRLDPGNATAKENLARLESARGGQ